MKTFQKNHATTRAKLNAPRRKQGGVVLFIALIVLVAMSLAGVSMMRAVDTGTQVAGNLAFRQSASHAADRASEVAMPQILNMVNSGTSNADGAVAGYSRFDVAQAVQDRDWTTAQNLPVDATTGNSVSYLIERLCTPAGAGSNSCQVTRVLIPGMPGADLSRPDPPPNVSLQHFRTIVRVADAKGNATFFEFKTE